MSSPITHPLAQESRPRNAGSIEYVLSPFSGTFESALVKDGLQECECSIINDRGERNEVRRAMGSARKRPATDALTTGTDVG